MTQIPIYMPLSIAARWSSWRDNHRIWTNWYTSNVHVKWSEVLTEQNHFFIWLIRWSFILYWHTWIYMYTKIKECLVHRLMSKCSLAEAKHISHIYGIFKSGYTGLLLAHFTMTNPEQPDKWAIMMNKTICKVLWTHSFHYVEGTKDGESVTVIT